MKRIASSQTTSWIRQAMGVFGRRRLSMFSWPPRSRLRLLEAAARQLPRIRELRRLLQATTRLAVRYLGAGHATVYLEDASSPGSAPLYRLTLSHGPQKPPEIAHFTADSQLIQWLHQHRNPLRFLDCQPSSTLPRTAARARSDPYGRLHLILENLHAELVVPSFSGKRLLGFLVLGARGGGHGGYPEEVVEALRRLAEGCAIALANAASYEQLKTTAKQLHAAQETLIRQERTVAAGRLAMGLAHEIKNPLAAIKTFVEFLPERYDDPAFRQEFTRIVTKEVDRINAIVQSLADVAKKPLLLKSEPTDVQQALQETVALLSNDCLKRNVALQTTFEPTQILVSGDAGQLKQAFLNLCMNALQAMPKGGTLSVSCAYHGSQAVIRIADTGVGIPKEHLPVLFDPFFSTKDGGMGLGLAVVKQIVEQHFGSIHVESEPGVGSAFEIRLPWAMPLTQAQHTAPRAPLTFMETSSLAKPVDLLIVDDEPRVRDVLTEHFASQGCRVRGVGSGEEALRLLETDPPQLVLLDLKLEGIDGMETLVRLKQRAPALPVIVISGNIEDDAMESHLRALGALACLRKPINLTTLQRHIMELSARLAAAPSASR